MSTQSKCIAILTALGISTGAHAEDQSWNAFDGGVFGDASNWGDGFNGEVPGFDDTAIFDLSTIYTVTFLQSRVNDRLRVRSGQVTFDLGSSLYSLLEFSPISPGLAVGLGDGDLAALTLTHGTVTAPYASCAHESDAIGTLQVTGPDAELLVSQQLWVGRLGVGFMAIRDGALVSNGTAEIGQGGGAYGVATIEGLGSRWSCDGALTVGNGGYGALTVTGGAVVECDDAIVAQQLGTQAEVVVSGPGSTWTIDGTLDVGMTGLAAMSITGGALVSNHTFATIGTFPTSPFVGGGQGDVLVADALSQWLVDGDLYIGFQNVGSLTVADGAVVTVTGVAHVGLETSYYVSGHGDLLVAGGHVDVGGELNAARGAFEPPDALHVRIDNQGGPSIEVTGPFTTNRAGLTVDVTAAEDLPVYHGRHVHLIAATEGLEALEVDLPPLPPGYLWGVRRRPVQLTLIMMDTSLCGAAPDGSDDCDADGIRDVCEVIYGIAPDCNENLVPDTCEIDHIAEFRSGYVTPFGVDAPVDIVIPRVQPAAGDVTVAAASRYGTNPSRGVTVFVNAAAVGEIFSPTYCSSREGELVIPPATFNDLVTAGEDAVVTFAVPMEVDDFPCGTPFMEATVRYPVLGTNDRNHNGLVDDCEPLCDADVTGPEPGVPDGNVDALDFLVMITEWGSPCTGGCLGDITGPSDEPDGVVDALDMLLLIAQWGSPADCS